MTGKSALIIVDVQNDFCPGGALPVPTGDRVAVALGQLAARFLAAGLPVYASRDWHPAKSGHFLRSGGQWPDHCIVGTNGAAFHAALALSDEIVIISKGMAPNTDGYSAFEGQTEEGKLLRDHLREQEVEHLYIGGLATDYCVRATVLDALSHGFTVSLLTDCVAGVDVEQGDSARALEEMREAGTQFCQAGELSLK